jgi:hypothetical protein
LLPVVVKHAQLSPVAEARVAPLELTLETKRGRLTLRGAVEGTHLSLLVSALRG